jgi:hypothetical protein
LFSKKEDYILGLKVYPFALNNYIDTSESGIFIGDNKEIKYYIQGESGEQSFTNANEVVSRVIRIGYRIFIPSITGNFLETPPYSTYTLHLPFIGYTQLDYTLIRGSRYIYIDYIIDVMTGESTVYISSMIDDAHPNKQLTINVLTGSVGVDIPISTTNRSEIARSNLTNAIAIGGALVGTAVSGGALAPLIPTTLASASVNAINSNVQRVNKGSLVGGVTSLFDDLDVFLIIEKTSARLPCDEDIYGREYGFLYGKNQILENVNGFIVCDDKVSIESEFYTGEEIPDFKPTLSSEKTEIETLLKSGVIV